MMSNRYDSKAPPLPSSPSRRPDSLAQYRKSPAPGILPKPNANGDAGSIQSSITNSLDPPKKNKYTTQSSIFSTLYRKSPVPIENMVITVTNHGEEVDDKTMSTTTTSGSMADRQSPPFADRSASELEQRYRIKVVPEGTEASFTTDRIHNGDKLEAIESVELEDDPSPEIEQQAQQQEHRQKEGLFFAGWGATGAPPPSEPVKPIKSPTSWFFSSSKPGALETPAQMTPPSLEEVMREMEQSGLQVRCLDEGGEGNQPEQATPQSLEQAMRELEKSGYQVKCLDEGNGFKPLNDGAEDFLFDENDDSEEEQEERQPAKRSSIGWLFGSGNAETEAASPSHAEEPGKNADEDEAGYKEGLLTAEDKNHNSSSWFWSSQTPVTEPTRTRSGGGWLWSSNEVEEGKEDEDKKNDQGEDKEDAVDDGDDRKDLHDLELPQLKEGEGDDAIERQLSILESFGDESRPPALPQQNSAGKVVTDTGHALSSEQVAGNDQGKSLASFAEETEDGTQRQSTSNLSGGLSGLMQGLGSEVDNKEKEETETPLTVKQLMRRNRKPGTFRTLKKKQKKYTRKLVTPGCKHKASALIDDKNKLNERWSLSQDYVAHVFQTYRENVFEDHGTDDFEAFQEASSVNQTFLGKLRKKLLEDGHLSEREIASFAEGFTLLSVKLQSLQSQIDAWKNVAKRKDSRALPTFHSETDVSDNPETQEAMKEYIAAHKALCERESSLADLGIKLSDEDSDNDEWNKTNEADNQLALQKILRHMPVGIRLQSEVELGMQLTPNGKVVPKRIIKKFKRANVLQLLRVDPDDVFDLHPTVLETLRTSGLTLTERRAIHAHLRDIGSEWGAMKDHDSQMERRWLWWTMMKTEFRECLDEYQKHCNEYGPPNNHPYATRTRPVGCPLVGKNCPVKADKMMDYHGDYGYPDGAVYESRRSDDTKVAEESEDDTIKDSVSDRLLDLKHEYDGNPFQATLANASCHAMTETISHLRRIQSGWVEEDYETDGQKADVLEEILADLRLSLVQVYVRAGMQLTEKDEVYLDQPDPRKATELKVCKGFCAAAKGMLTWLDERTKELQCSTSQLKETRNSLKDLLSILHQRNLTAFSKDQTSDPRHSPSRGEGSFDEKTEESSRKGRSKDSSSRKSGSSKEHKGSESKKQARRSSAVGKARSHPWESNDEELPPEAREDATSGDNTKPASREITPRKDDDPKSPAKTKRSSESLSPKLGRRLNATIQRLSSELSLEPPPSLKNSNDGKDEKDEAKAGSKTDDKPVKEKPQSFPFRSNDRHKRAPSICDDSQGGSRSSGFSGSLPEESSQNESSKDGKKERRFSFRSKERYKSRASNQGEEDLQESNEFSGNIHNAATIDNYSRHSLVRSSKHSGSHTSLTSLRSRSRDRREGARERDRTRSRSIDSHSTTEAARLRLTQAEKRLARMDSGKQSSLSNRLSAFDTATETSTGDVMSAINERRRKRLEARAAAAAEKEKVTDKSRDKSKTPERRKPTSDVLASLEARRAARRSNEAEKSPTGKSPTGGGRRSVEEILAAARERRGKRAEKTGRSGDDVLAAIAQRRKEREQRRAAEKAANENK